MKKSCVIYDSWADQIINLPDEMAGEYAKKILRYAIYGEEVEFDNPALSAMFISAKRRLDEDDQKYKAQVDRMNKNREQKEVGMKSDRSQTEVRPMSRRSRTEVAGDNDNDNDNDNNKKNKKQSFRNFKERKYDYEELLKGAADV